MFDFEFVTFNNVIIKKIQNQCNDIDFYNI